MTPTTREHALAAMKQAGIEKRVDMDSLFRFWSLAMEHAAGICDASAFYEDDPQGYARQCAAAIREAGK